MTNLELLATCRAANSFDALALAMVAASTEEQKELRQVRPLLSEEEAAAYSASYKRISAEIDAVVNKKLQKVLPCTKCAGNGGFHMYAHVSKGVCFACNGTGTRAAQDRVATENRMAANIRRFGHV